MGRVGLHQDAVQHLVHDARDLPGTLLQGTDGRVADQRLFGAIVGIGGRYKVLSFGNDF